jgi:hypothetical protein
MTAATPDLLDNRRVFKATEHHHFFKSGERLHNCCHNILLSAQIKTAEKISLSSGFTSCWRGWFGSVSVRQSK